MSDTSAGSVRVANTRPFASVRPLADSDPRAAELLELRSTAELRQAESEARTRLFEAVAASFDQQRESVDQRLDEIASWAAEFGLRLASVVLDEELRDDRGLERRARAALEALGGKLRDRDVELRTHPDSIGTLTGTFQGEPGIRIAPDASLPKGTVQAENHTGAQAIVDPVQQLIALTDAVRDELEAP